MFSSRQSHNLINKIHERLFRLIKNDENSCFETLLEHNKDVTKHILWLKFIKLPKGKYRLLWKTYLFFRKTFIMLEISKLYIANENKNTVRYGLEIICYRTPYLWTSLPEECKHQNFAGKFKETIKNWKS